MFSIIQAAGWPIWPLLLASVISVALIIERLVALRRVKVVPSGLLQRAVGEFKRGANNDRMLEELERHSPLGRVLAAGLRNVGRFFMINGVVDKFSFAAGNHKRRQP